MIKIRNPRYKICFQLKENIWKNSKVVAFKRKKWLKIAHFFKRGIALNYNLLNKKTKYSKKFSIKQLYPLILKFKKSLVNFYGPMKVSFLKNLVRRLAKKGVSLQVKRKLQNKILSSSVEQDKVMHFINALESMLAISLYRLNIAKSIFEAYQIISHGFIRVNGKIIKNPKFFLRVSDIVTVDAEFIKKRFSGRKNVEVGEGSILKSSHLLINYSNFNCVRVSKIIRNIPKFQWGLLDYIFKTKRR